MLNLSRLYSIISVEVWRKELTSGLSDCVNMSESGGTWAARCSLTVQNQSGPSLAQKPLAR
jgi:hypothetical protein